jgi:outer membrane protein assembly factor BamB
MKQFLRGRSALITYILLAVPGIGSAAYGAVNVTGHHNHASRDGLYIDPAFTQTAATNLKRDLTFSGAISGNVYAQPLYIEDGPGGRAMVIAVTESNNVYALDAATGAPIWQRKVGTPVSRSSLPCGNIDPLGITGTPVVDLASRTLLFDAMTTPDGGTTKKHFLFALNVDTGTTNSGWPVDLNATARFSTNVFNSTVQNQRSALGLLGGNVYVTYSGHAGDCGNYFGWVVSVPLANPANVQAWCTTARGGGIWAVGGVVNDGTNVFVATGNTFNATTWAGGEAIIRLQPGATFSGLTNDFWTPANWNSLDTGDLDIGGSGPLLVDVPGATPSALMVALGKDGNAYLLNRTNFGGINTQLAQSHVSSSDIIQAAATYRTTQGVYVVYCGNTSQIQLSAFRIGATNPPTITSAWTKTQNGRGSPFVTSTDGTNNVIVWGLGTEGSSPADQRLHGFDGDTGNTVFAGGGSAELMAGLRRFSTGIAARGRIYVAGDSRVYAFTLPVSPLRLTGMTSLPDGTFQFGFSNQPGMGFTVFSSTNVTTPFTNWTRLGFASEISSGNFQFTDLQATNNQQRFYRVRSP